MLQQYLPLAVLKLDRLSLGDWYQCVLQQYLPLAVLKLNSTEHAATDNRLQQYLPLAVLKLDFYLETERLLDRCNSTYRLRY